MDKFKKVFQGELFTIKQGYLKSQNKTDLFYETCQRPPAVGVLAIDNQKRIILTREFRHHLGRTIWRIPLGGLEDNRRPDGAARQELLEEAGFKAGQFDLFYKSTAGSSVQFIFYFYLARDLKHVGKDLEPDEHNRVHKVNLKRAHNLALKNGFHNENISYAIIRLWHERKKWLK
ncbi:MAG: NUDIX hydrolase [Patescibacteria group bacterium]